MRTRWHGEKHVGSERSLYSARPWGRTLNNSNAGLVLQDLAVKYRTDRGSHRFAMRTETQDCAERKTTITKAKTIRKTSFGLSDSHICCTEARASNEIVRFNRFVVEIILKLSRSS
jgi:hypothetical protein